MEATASEEAIYVPPLDFRDAFKQLPTQQERRYLSRVAALVVRDP